MEYFHFSGYTLYTSNGQSSKSQENSIFRWGKSNLIGTELYKRVANIIICDLLQSKIN